MLEFPPVAKLLSTMSEELRDLYAERGVSDPLLIGIHTGGSWVAQALKSELPVDSVTGALDISFHRDDFSRIGINPKVAATQLPWDIDGRHILLVDDIIYTGRTIRAAMNALFDYGRPASITLAVLVDRGGRELPIQADVTGFHLSTPEDRQIKLSGPEDLTLELVSDDNR